MFAVIGLLLILVWMFYSADAGYNRFQTEKDHAQELIVWQDSVIQDLKRERAAITNQIVQQDSLIAKLEYNGQKLRVELADGLKTVANANQILEYNETDSALVELLRSAYSYRTEPRN